MKTLIALFAFFIASASAADITGTWKGTADGPNGTIERTFVFKQMGSTVTGESSSEMMGKSTIANGKVDGDNLSFSLNVKFQDQELTVSYTGKISGDTMKLHAEGNGFAVDYTVKKTS